MPSETLACHSRCHFVAGVLVSEGGRGWAWVGGGRGSRQILESPCVSSAFLGFHFSGFLLCIRVSIFILVCSGMFVNEYIVFMCIWYTWTKIQGL